MSVNGVDLTRIGVFYDGNYFFYVSNYYAYAHARKSRISVRGLHDFVIREISRLEDVDHKFCRIVDAHYFRGRLQASEAQSRGVIYSERLFEDVLMRERVVTHYLPLTSQGEKGVDVLFSLEALELAMLKKFDVVVLVVCDGDYISLVRKINTIGTRVMVLGWDFTYKDNNGHSRTTTTSVQLLQEATYPIVMNEKIDNKTNSSDPIISNLFFHRKDKEDEDLFPSESIAEPEENNGNIGNIGNIEDDDEGLRVRGADFNLGLVSDSSEFHYGTVVTMNAGYGFVSCDKLNKNLFFHCTDIVDESMKQIKCGDRVKYTIGVDRKKQGECAKKVELVEE